MFDLGVYGGLFGLSFLAATLLPASSEAGLAGLILNENYSLIALIFCASLGNTLGSSLNWYLGKGIETFKEKRWFPVDTGKLDKASIWYHKYGRWSLLLSWVPIIGDPLTVIAGTLREPFVSFFVIVGFAKTLRYVLVATITLGVLNI